MSGIEPLWHSASRIVLPHTDDAMEVPVQGGDRQWFALVHGTWRHYPDGYPVLDTGALLHLEAASVRLMWADGPAV